jgi:hypothetical protein
MLTPVHSLNNLVRHLSEQQAWRRFAHLSNRQEVPDVWILNQFRERYGVSGLRQINEHLLEPLLPKCAGQDLALALIDATDLEAACSGHKKRPPDSIQPSALPWEAERLSAAKVVSL